MFLIEYFKDSFRFPVSFGLSSNSSLSICSSRGQGCDSEDFSLSSEYLEKLADNFLGIFSPELPIFRKDLIFLQNNPENNNDLLLSYNFIVESISTVKIIMLAKN